MGHHRWHLRPLPSPLPRKLSARTEKAKKGLSTSRLSTSMREKPNLKTLVSIANDSLSGSLLAVNENDLSHPHRTISLFAEYRTDIQCTVMRLRLQVCFLNPP